MSGRSIHHPGPVAAVRHAAVACQAQPLTLVLEPGKPFNAAVADAFAVHGFDGGYMLLEDVPMRRMNYVIPAASPEAEHAAWYSDTRAPAGGGLIKRAGLHLGSRDGEAFLHCHGLWNVPGEGVSMGHLLPFEAEVASATAVRAFGVSGALLDVADDAETNFRLFAPRPAAASKMAGSHRAVLATVRPNEDICLAIEAICAEHGLAEANIHGIGSLVGAEYADGRHISSYATEVLIRDGRVGNSAEGPRAALDIAMVGMEGGISQGLLERGANPVCVTFELLIVG
ncbi:aminopeptidase P family protein [Nitratireductor sp. ZSWI3]|uniref:aminopeptidase P family protein n=1 Tax=Nitratireductor sp. ZSWI3 TaxID=2966359 RepID=UPI0021502AAE|nr:aminopeptidase P family protein [Nitratireductor sp. ZSWI3]MCR4268851.1 aminopeptidase P family protein [Nitratireductor sp. ZSWI3]